MNQERRIVFVEDEQQLTELLFVAIGSVNPYVCVDPSDFNLRIGKALEGFHIQVYRDIVEASAELQDAILYKCALYEELVQRTEQIQKLLDRDKKRGDAAEKKLFKEE